MKLIVNENQIKMLINERLSSVLYHFTSIENAYKIISDNAFYLASAYKGDADNLHKTKKFYISFTRQANGKIGYSQGRSVRIEFDGDMLNQRFEGKAVDYWGDVFGKHSYFRRDRGERNFDYSQSSTENEDRLFSNEPVIRDINKYIKRVDVYLALKNEDEEVSIDNFKNTNNLLYAQNMAFILHDKVNIYSNYNDFCLKTDKTITKWVTDTWNMPKMQSYLTNKCDCGYDVFKILQFFNWCEEPDKITKDNLTFDKRRSNNLSNDIKILKNYRLEKFIPTVTKKYRQNEDISLDRPSIQIGTILNDIRSLDKESYPYVGKMIDDFLKSHGYNSYYDAKVKVSNKFRELNRGKDYSNYDTTREPSVFVFHRNGYTEFTGNYVILEPDKDKFWDLFKDGYAKDYFVQEVESKVESHNSKDWSHFEKFLQHLVKGNPSVTQMLNVLNSLNYVDGYDSEQMIDDLFAGKFMYINLPYWEIWRQKFIYDGEKEKVEELFINK